MDRIDYAGRQPDNEIENEQQVQYITFLVETEEYGVEALRVQGIIRYQSPVKVPNAPDPIQGVINFRGEVIPILDLRKTFGLSPLRIDEFTVIVIVEFEGKIFGIIADRILDMVDIPVSRINPAAASNSTASQNYLQAMVKIDGRLILILDLNKIITFDTGLPESVS